MKSNFKAIIGIMLFIIGTIWGILIPLSNPDMTELRLMITYWKEYIGITVVVLGGYFLIKESL